MNGVPVKMGELKEQRRRVKIQMKEVRVVLVLTEETVDKQESSRAFLLRATSAGRKGNNSLGGYKMEI
jgi:hypothetical protein